MYIYCLSEVGVCECDLWQLRSPLLDAVFDPGHDGIEHLLLTPNIQLITGNDVYELIGWEQHELLTLHDLSQARETRTHMLFTTFDLGQQCWARIRQEKEKQRGHINMNTDTHAHTQ